MLLNWTTRITHSAATKTDRTSGVRAARGADRDRRGRRRHRGRRRGRRIFTSIVAKLPVNDSCAVEHVRPVGGPPSWRTLAIHHQVFPEAP